MRDILKDLWKKKILVIICLFICIVAGVITGYKKTNFYDRISTKDKIKVEKYYEQLNKYEQNIKDSEESIKLLNTKIKELQGYIDNSIFMHLNPDKIYVANAQFSSESLITETDYLKDKYWSDLVNISSKGNIYNISIMQSTEKQALEDISIIVENIKKEYRISEPIITCYIKADASIVKQQKGHLDNLKSYIKNRTDLENSLKKQKTIASKYKSEAKPKVLSQKDLRPISVILRYALFGFVAGFLGLISVFTIRRVL